jgi:DNA-binding MarR family transcriptional regulator
VDCHDLPVPVIGVDDAISLRRSVSKLARKFNATATDEELTPTQASVLGLIATRGPIGVAELVELEHINPTMLSRVVGRLDEAGLVLRQQHPDDLRAALFEATAKGRRTHERVKAQRANLVLHGIAALPADQQAALRAALPALESLAEAMP